MLSQTTEYALRAVVALAQSPDSPQTAQQLSLTTRVPTDYLSKVLQGLGKSGLVSARRGKNGGFNLARPPADLTVLDVVNAVEPILRIHHCPLQLKAHGTHLCPLHRRLDQVLGQVEQAFGSTTIQEVLAEPSSSRPLCEFPLPVAHA